MKKEPTAAGDPEGLARVIAETSRYFTRQAEKQVNVAMTLRNWLIGFHLVAFEQQGRGRAAYGDSVLEKVAARLKAQGVKGMSVTNLKLFRQFYSTYPEIRQTLSDQLPQLEALGIGQALSDAFAAASGDTPNVPPGQLVNALSFSHFIELLKADTPLKRRFYEVEAVRNNWGVRELKRAMGSLLYERIGLSTDKRAVLEKGAREPAVEDVFKNPYVLEFLGLEERPAFSELDLEQAIIDHLQAFLLEMGRGFCFEARQKRITFDNTHYRIDLVFYHRILKCHVLVDLKIGEFSHADAGQMNMYLNYYRENEMAKGDRDPVGIILCAGKNERLVRYATMGLPQKVFVSKYLVNLPSESELEGIIAAEQQKLQQPE